MTLLSFAGLVAYFGLPTFIRKGATLGKRLVGIRVVSRVHSRMSPSHCIERALGHTASSIEAGFGLVPFFTHTNRQSVHDRTVETFVIRTRPPKSRAAA
ncbi:MAG TPA: RDD family protein [Burkholderiaceae bacterium]|nr:RDD family protein [Burkholderiaceae bacterium]